MRSLTCRESLKDSSHAVFWVKTRRLYSINGGWKDVLVVECQALVNANGKERRTLQK